MIFTALISVQIFSEGTWNSPTQHISIQVAVGTFVSMAGVTVGAASRILPPRQFWQGAGHWWNVHSVLYVISKKEVRWCNVRGTR
jgi:hypothetical protein